MEGEFLQGRKEIVHGGNKQPGQIRIGVDLISDSYGRYDIRKGSNSASDPGVGEGLRGCGGGEVFVGESDGERKNGGT